MWVDSRSKSNPCDRAHDLRRLLRPRRRSISTYSNTPAPTKHSADTANQRGTIQNRVSAIGPEHRSRPGHNPVTGVATRAGRGLETPNVLSGRKNRSILTV